MSTQACRRARSTARTATLPSLPAFFYQGGRASSSDAASLATELAGLAAAGTGESPGESEGPRRKYDAMIARGELRQDSNQARTVDQLERVYQDLVASRLSRSGSGLTLVDASSSTKQTRRRTGWWGSIVDSLGDRHEPSSAPLDQAKHNLLKFALIRERGAQQSPRSVCGAEINHASNGVARLQELSNVFRASKPSLPQFKLTNEARSGRTAPLTMSGPHPSWPQRPAQAPLQIGSYR